MKFGILMKLDCLSRKSDILPSVYDGKRHLSDVDYELLGKGSLLPEFVLPGCRDVSLFEFFLSSMLFFDI
jgi:hypothetical protein